MNYCNFAGNEKLKEQLNQLFESGRLPHALLLEGPQGSGRRTLARLIAAALVCTGGGEKPCLTCAACAKSMVRSHPDITELDSPNGKMITVDAIREIRKDIYILPNEGICKVYIIADAQTMNEQAQNALLKILEEPPEHGMFILNCHSRHELIPTILSRTAVFTLNGVQEKEAVRVVRGMLPETESAAVEEAAAVWGGVIGQMLEGLQSGRLQQAMELSVQVIRGIVSNGELELMLATGRFEKDKELFRAVLSLLKLIFRDSLVFSMGGTTTLSGCVEEARMLSETLTAGQIMQLTAQAEEAENALQRNANAALLVTHFCYSLRRCAGR